MNTPGNEHGRPAKSPGVPTAFKIAIAAVFATSVMILVYAAMVRSPGPVDAARQTDLPATTNAAELSYPPDVDRREADVAADAPDADVSRGDGAGPQLEPEPPARAALTTDAIQAYAAERGWRPATSTAAKVVRDTTVPVDVERMLRCLDLADVGRESNAHGILRDALRDYGPRELWDDTERTPEQLRSLRSLAMEAESVAKMLDAPVEVVETWPCD